MRGSAIHTARFGALILLGIMGIMPMRAQVTVHDRYLSIAAAASDRA